VSAGSGVLVDTSAWIETLRPDGDAKIRSAVSEAADAGRAHLCDMVLLELWNGAGNPHEKSILRNLERLVPTLPTTEEVWGKARDLARECRGAGLTLPGADLVIAACARVHGLALLHKDAHFDRLAAALGGGGAAGQARAMTPRRRARRASTGGHPLTGLRVPGG
jgi:predicted nucleic acid-binding protein